VPSSSEYWKQAHPLEALGADELLEQREVLLGLARKPGDQRGAEGEPGDAGAELRQERDQERAVAAAPHRAQQPVRGVLQRHVQVLGDLRLARMTSISASGNTRG
jgi:hypothetical protein